MNAPLFVYFREKSKFSENMASILRTLIQEEEASAGRIAEILNLSIPTVTKALDNLVERGFVLNLGKKHIEGGRMPVIFSPNPSSAYFMGVEVRRHFLEVGISDFSGNIVYRSGLIPFMLEEEDSFEKLCGILEEQFNGSNYKDRLVACTLSIPGRINIYTGESYNYFRNSGGLSLTEVLEDKFNIKVYVDNDSRIMCYGEYICSHLSKYKNILYINLNWGLGMGMILDGKLYYGATGLSGELGHITMFDNEIFCRCGKKGCIETEASGFAAQRLLLSKHKAGAQSTLSAKINARETLTLDDFVRAVHDGDMTMIEIIEEIGTQLGKGIAAMINIFNPQLVVLGGELSKTGDYLRMATTSSVRKYSLNIVNRDTTIEQSRTSSDINLLGSCFIARDKSLGIL